MGIGIPTALWTIRIISGDEQPVQAEKGNITRSIAKTTHSAFLMHKKP
jgi:hypothetical protein